MLRRHLIAGALLAGAGVRVARACEAPVSVPAVFTGGALLLDARIDGQPARLLLDTGAERSVLTAAGVAALNLRRDSWVSTGMRGVGGVERQPNADVRSITLGGVALRRPLLRGIESLPVIPTQPVAWDGKPIDGLLGTDLLAGYDIEIDFAAPRLLLHRCVETPAWARDVPPVAAGAPRIGILVVPMRVGAATLRALLDTGSSSTLVGQAAASRIGITAADIAGGAPGVSRGIGPATLAGHRVTLARLRLGGVAWQDRQAWIAALRDPAYDMVLGMDLLAGHPLFLSPRRGLVWIGSAA